MGRLRFVFLGAALVIALASIPARTAESVGPPSMTPPQAGQTAAPGMWWTPNASQLAARAGLDYLKLARQTAFADTAACPGCPTLSQLAASQPLPGAQGLYALSGQAPISANGGLACPAGQQPVVLRTGTFCANWLLWNGFIGYETVKPAAGAAWLPGPTGLPSASEPPTNACDVQQWYQSPDRTWGLWTVWRYADGLSPADVVARTTQGWSSETADWSPSCASVAADGTRTPGRYLVQSAFFGQPPR